MLLLTLSSYRSLLLRQGYGYPAPRGAVMPEHNEIVLLARRRWTSRGVEHSIRWAMRGTSLKLPPLHPLRGRTRWIIARESAWRLQRPFRLEGIQLTPIDYAAGLSVQRLDGQDAGAVHRQGLLTAAAGEVEFEAEPATPEDTELRNAFHMLWSKAVGQKDYVKKEWNELYGMLDKRGVFKFPPREEKVG